MAATIIKCPDCGRTEESEDGASKTCPACEGTMTALPPKKKYQARSTSLEEEERLEGLPQKRRPAEEEGQAPRRR